MTKLHLSSDWTNVINAVLFEVVLITTIFYLTADVCARLNYLALVDGSVQDLCVVSPPLLGGGVVSTSRKRSITMIFLRGLSVLLIFGTTLTIEGETINYQNRITKEVRTVGEVHTTDEESKKRLNSLIPLRSSCVSIINDSLVYGRLDVDNYCETNETLLDNPVSIRIPTETMNFSITSGCQQDEVIFQDFKGLEQQKAVTTSCKRDKRQAKVICFKAVSKNRTLYSECVGTFQLTDTKWYVCDAFAATFTEGTSLKLSLPCHIARNLEKIHELWPRAMLTIFRTSIMDLLGVVSINRVQSMPVIVLKERDITTVHNMWFLCLAVKLGLLVVLGVYSLILRVQRARRVLNDDRALLGLVRQKLDDWGVNPSNEKQPIYLHLHESNNGDKRVWASTNPNYHSVESRPET